MKILRREIQIRRATQGVLRKAGSPDKKRIATLTGEIFELQRIILTKAQTNGMMAAV